MPHMEAGLRTEPPVSVPSAAGTMPAASATPEPLEEPPGKWLPPHGFTAGGQGRSNDGPPMANSCVASLPIRMPPAALSRAVTGASAAATLSISTLECAVVGRPAASMMSLRAKGTPCSGPLRLPAAISRSAWRAAASARSGVRRMNA